jgi:hypothetical protein
VLTFGYHWRTYWAEGLVDALLPLASSLRHLDLRWPDAPYQPWLTRMTALERLILEMTEDISGWWQERAPSSLTSLWCNRYHLTVDTPLPRLRELTFTESPANWFHDGAAGFRSVRSLLTSLHIIRLPQSIKVRRGGPAFSADDHIAMLRSPPKRRRRTLMHTVETDVIFKGFEWHAEDRRVRTRYNLLAQVPSGSRFRAHDYQMDAPAWIARRSGSGGWWEVTPIHPYPCSGPCCRERNIPFECSLWSQLEIVKLYDTIYKQ